MAAAAPSLVLAGAISLAGTRERLTPERRRALARRASRPGAVLFPTAKEAARHLAAGTVAEVVLLWRTGLGGKAGEGFSAPFAAPGGKPRLSFALAAVHPAPQALGPGVIARYAVEKAPGKVG